MNIFSGIIEIFTSTDYMSYVWSGLGKTLLISVFASLLGLVLGIIVALVKISYPKRKKALCVPNAICSAYVTVIRGTPVALQLFIMVFAVFAIRGFPVEITAIITFGINSGAYVSESIRAGILSIDKGQTEAGLSLGLSGGQTMRLIVIPQAIKNVIPTIGNELIALIKETSIVSMVGIVDLTFAAKIIGAGDKMADYLVPMLVAAFFYLAVVYILTFVIKYVEKRLRRGDRV
ncbi:MAG: amino acid ABC transporter permease [Clostridia bacterium]|nr:amino acid ABC transporter permease [Clostridiales bacterium]MBR2029818.1 amino acid ABC transporter permease [Clostridia bacterium]